MYLKKRKLGKMYVKDNSENGTVFQVGPEINKVVSDLVGAV